MQLKETADFWEENHHRKYREAVWLPGDERPEGLAQTDVWQDPYHASSYHHVHAQILADVYHGSQLKSVLDHVGIRAHVGGSGFKDIESTQVHFPAITALSERVQELNETLPAEHALPTFEPFAEGSYSARDFLSALASGKILVSTGENDPSPRDAMTVAHDMTFHIPYWLALTPSAMQHLQTSAGEALLATPEGAVETDSVIPKLKTGQVMGALDSGIAAFAMAGMLLSEYSSPTIEFARAFGTTSYGAIPIANEIREHVAYLDEHISGLDLAA
ncbi:MAG TPA: hypothetical protein VLA92_03655 [Candidatus Saccharimonadales bacterium]|nr:hypothetical protein [Candidatus Saccharimonadales bacterium]